MKHHPRLMLHTLTVTAASLALLAPGMARAAQLYKIQPVVRLGDVAGDVPLPPELALFVCGLNDNGQLLLRAGTSDGSAPEILLQSDNGVFTPIAVAGMEGPLGRWPGDLFLADLVPCMNQRGSAVLTLARSRSSTPLGTFLWDVQARRLTPIAVDGTPAGDNLEFTGRVGYVSAINNRDEIALVAAVRDPTGSAGVGLFFREREGKLTPVLLPGGTLPVGTAEPSNAWLGPSINDAGVIAFLTWRAGQNELSAYRWEQGKLTSLVPVGTNAPEGGRISSVSSVFVNNQNRNALVTAGTDGSYRQGVYRVADGKLIPVVVPGWELPGGGRFNTVARMRLSPQRLWVSGGEISAANEAGEHALLAELEDGSVAAFKIAADGSLSSILRSGASTPLGRITLIPSPLSLNGKGQVALTARVDDGPETILLLTPTTP
jgi:hypothetical protein